MSVVELVKERGGVVETAELEVGKAVVGFVEEEFCPAVEFVEELDDVVETTKLVVGDVDVGFDE